MGGITINSPFEADIERAWWFLSSLVIVHAGYEETGRTSAILETLGGPSMAPLHVHPDQDEAIYVLDGAMRLYVGRDVIDLGPGQFFNMPRGVPHTVEVTATLTRDLSWIAGPFDEFVQDIGVRALELRAPLEGEVPEGDPDEIVGLAAKRGITVLGPPGMLPTELPEFAGSGS